MYYAELYCAIMCTSPHVAHPLHASPIILLPDIECDHLWPQQAQGGGAPDHNGGGDQNGQGARGGGAAAAATAATAACTGAHAHRQRVVVMRKGGLVEAHRDMVAVQGYKSDT